MTIATNDAECVSVGASRWARIAGSGFVLSWIAGLSVFSSSTDVRSSGTVIIGSYTGHVPVVVVQYLLTEGLPAVCLAVVGLTLARAIRNARTRIVIACATLSAAVVSLVELALGWGIAHLVASGSNESAGSAENVGELYRALNRLDGVKMVLLAALAVATVVAIRRGSLALPRWVDLAGTLTAVTITVSAVGYVFLVNALALAAWASLPCLIVFITGAGVMLRPSVVTDVAAIDDTFDDELANR